MLRSVLGSDCAVPREMGRVEGKKIIVFTIAGMLTWSCPVLRASLNLWIGGRKRVYTEAIFMLILVILNLDTVVPFWV